jgi:hypothetical protein
MFELPTERSSTVLEIGNFWAIILVKQDDNDTDGEISEFESEVLGESTLSSDIEEDDLNDQEDVLQLDQPHREKTI